jgi:hypothetical protein
MLDHVKGKVVEPAETPNRNPEQHGGLDLEMLDKKKGRGQKPDDQEQNALELDPTCIGEVFHTVVH